MGAEATCCFKPVNTAPAPGFCSLCLHEWLTSVVYLDESIREAFDRDGPGQVGSAQVGGTSVLQLSLTSEQTLQEWQSHNRRVEQQLLHVSLSLVNSLMSPLFARSQTPVFVGKTLKKRCVRSGCSRIPHGLFLINEMSHWERGFSLPIRTPWQIYYCTLGPLLHQCPPPPNPSYRSVEIKKTTSSGWSNSFLFPFCWKQLHLLQNICLVSIWDATIVAMIASGLHFDDSLEFSLRRGSVWNIWEFAVSSALALTVRITRIIAVCVCHCRDAHVAGICERLQELVLLFLSRCFSFTAR